MKDYNEMAESVFARRDAYNAERRRALRQVRKGMTGAVGCCLAVLLGVGVYHGSQIVPKDTPAPGVQDHRKNRLETSTKEVGSGQDVDPAPYMEDVPADQDGDYVESVSGGKELRQGIAAFFGGSYTDANGDYVVVLTADTAEHRAAVCKELGVAESTTVFKVGDYTLAYLTELQSQIGSAMTNKELPFVISSAVDERGNRIKVRVTTDREADRAKVLALDTVGGAIVIERAAGLDKEAFATAE